MNHIPLKIESLLERMGSVEIPEEALHRYELRRELLYSRYFLDHGIRQQRWNRFMTFTVPLLTGGMLVVVFTFVGSSLREPSPAILSVQPPDVTQVTSLEEPESQNEFVEINEPVFMYDMVKFVPVREVNYFLMQ